jgi:beta-glucanase (GH16 family)
MVGLELAPSWAYRDMLGGAWTGLLDGSRSMLEESVGQMDRARWWAVMGVIGLLLVGDSDPTSVEPREAPPVRTECGATLPKPGGGVWTCTFADEFDGASLDRTKWVVQTNHPTGTRSASSRSCHVDDPRNVAVRQGNLQLTVRKVRTPVVCNGGPANYTSASVTTFRKFSQRYGRFEARFKNTPIARKGLLEAFWLWPDDRVPSTVTWPAAGEIDIVETRSAYPRLAVPYLHYTASDNGGPLPGVNTAWNCRAARGVYNTYVLTWTPTRLAIDVNGRTCLVNTSGDPAFKKPYIVILTAALARARSAVAPNTALTATMSVDYVRVWR